MAYVTELFNLNDEAAETLLDLTPKFGYGGFGEVIYKRTYSRRMTDGSNENWNDTVLRVINGVFSIRKDWYCKNHIEWDEDRWQKLAFEMAISMFKMHWLPPGRGLWAMGTDYIYQRGSMSLYNCAFTTLGCNDTLANDLDWMMDCLMCGVGVGFEPIRDELKAYKPVGEYIHIIDDTREAWSYSVKLLVDAYTQPGRQLPKFIYTEIRPKGVPIKGFGGKASGPEPLIDLHKFIIQCFKRYLSEGDYDVIRLKIDIANKIGCCVVAGNVRRSAEIAIGQMDDPIFKDLKDYDKYPDREAYGWMSNNSVKLNSDYDFDSLGEIARRVIVRGEPGILNLRNFPLARIGKDMKGLRLDDAIGLNPCGEIPLKNKETCNIDETFPTICPTPQHWYEACRHATIYTSTVSLLPTHRKETNQVVIRNRRIGVGLADYTNWVASAGQHQVIKHMRAGYDIVRETNREMNMEAGVPEAIRVTTIKPGGTVPKLPGVVSGVGFPTFGYTKRLFSVPSNHSLCLVLDKAGVPFEPCWYDPNTLMYEFPIHQRGTPADQVSLLQQAMVIITVQREWSDNAVSNTLYFRPKWKLVKTYGFDELEYAMKILEGSYETEREKCEFKYDREGKLQEVKLYEFDPNHEEHLIEQVLSSIAPVVKSVSLLPHSPQGAYRQMPEQGISQDEYDARKAQIDVFDWSLFRDSDGEDERYCQGESCQIKVG